MAYALCPKNLFCNWHLPMYPFQIPQQLPNCSARTCSLHIPTGVLGSCGPPGLWSWSQTPKHLHHLSTEGRHFSPGLEIFPEAAAANWPHSVPIRTCFLVVPGFSSHQGCQVSFCLGGAILTVEIIYATFTSRHLTTICLLHAVLFLTDLLEDPKVLSSVQWLVLVGSVHQLLKEFYIR